jgi:putative flippase GtrA
VNADKPDIFDRMMTLPVLRLFEKFYQKHRGVLLYLFFGGLTTLISIVSFLLLDQVCHELIANFLSWIFAVAFAYVTNRTWVFRSRTRGKALRQEMVTFVYGRLATLVMEEVILLVFVTWLDFDSTFVKVLAQIVVLVLNYIISKLLVFRKKTQ